MSDANIRAVITAKDEASNVLKSFGNSASSMGDKLLSVAKVAAVGLAAAGAAAIAFGYESVKAYEDSENQLAQLNAVIKSTGGAAGVTSEAATKLALSLQKVTKYSDEEVLSAENLLLTFTSIGKDVFPDATKTVLDMSTALGQDLKSSSIQLGKALQDPVRGITALRRVGVNFSDAQKDVIENLVKSGKTMEAQKLILKELQTEFGGSAEAAGKTFAGSLAKLKNSFNDVQETIGLTIVNAITPFLQKAAEFVSAVDWEAVINRTKEAIRSLWQDHLVPIGEAIYQVALKVQEYLQPKFEALWHTIQEQLIPQLEKLWHNVIEPLMPVLGTALVVAIGLAVDALNAIITAVTSTVSWFEKHKAIADLLIGTFGALAVAMTMNAVFTALTGLFATFTTVTIPGAIAAMGSLSAAVTAAMPITIIIAPALLALAYLFQKAEELKAVLSEADAAVKQNYKSAGNLEKAQFTKMLNDPNSSPQAKANAQMRLNNLAAQGFANGTDFAPGGMALVGEQGAELVNLPRGSQVIPNDKIGGAMGNTVNVTFSGVFTGNEMEFRKLAIKVFQAASDVADMKNNEITGMTTQDWRRA